MTVDELPPYWRFTVFNLVGSNDLAVRWWNANNEHFLGLSPLDTWKINPNIVIGYLQSHLDFIPQ